MLIFASWLFLEMVVNCLFGRKGKPVPRLVVGAMWFVMWGWGVEMSENFDRCNKDYIELVVSEAQKLPDGVAEVENCLRPVVFEEVLVRVREDFYLSMHVDTDEGNAAGLTTESYGVI